MNDLLTTRQRRQFAAAQAVYENRAEPELSEDAPVPFSSDWADGWIRGLAGADDAARYLFSSAIDLGDLEADLAPLLQDMAVAYRDKPGAVHDLIGTRYFQTMKALAAVAYANQ